MMKTFSFFIRAGFNLKRIANILTVIVFAFSFNNAQAKKSHYSFEMLIGMSDAIVSGQISDVLGDTAYIFSISETVKGKTAHQIKVKLFREWICDVRWTKAVTGQQLFLFLKKDGSSYDIIGGSDGEIFIIDNQLRLVNIYSPNLKSPDFGRYFYEANYPELNDVISSVRNFISCYLFTNTKDSPRTFRQIKTDEEISVLKNINSFSVWLFDRVTDEMHNYKIIKPSPDIVSTNIVLRKAGRTK